MRSIICKKCGSPIDADLGECPLCGAVYYVLPENENTDETRVWDDETMGVVKAIDASLKETEPNLDETKVVDMSELSKTEVEPEKAEIPTPVNKPNVSKPKIPLKKPLYPKIDKKWLYIVAATALLAVITMIITAMSGAFNFEEEPSEMPQLVGLHKEVALGQLEELGIIPDTISEPSTEPENMVIRQAPIKGTIISEGEKVTLVISSGAVETPTTETEYVTVPNVKGENFATAKARLEGLGFFVSKNPDEFSETVSEGDVISQSPLADAQVEKGGTITLTTSKGKEPIEYSVNLTAGEGGIIQPNGYVSVEEDGSLILTITPDEGYEISKLLIDGVDMGALSYYTITNIQRHMSVIAEFTLIEEPVESDNPTESETPVPEESKRPSSASDIN